MSQCMITGCTLAKPDAIVHGDLHSEGGCWIFNAVLERTGEAAWTFGSHDNSRPALLIRNGAPYFERRGIIVVSGLMADLNDAALEYLS